MERMMNCGTGIQMNLSWVFKRTLDCHHSDWRRYRVGRSWTWGFIKSASRCLAVCGLRKFRTRNDEESVEGGSSKVDYSLLVDNKHGALIEAKSPSVMKKVGELLPSWGIELNWLPNQSLIPKIFFPRRVRCFFLSVVQFIDVCRSHCT